MYIIITTDISWWTLHLEIIGQRLLQNLACLLFHVSDDCFS